MRFVDTRVPRSHIDPHASRDTDPLVFLRKIFVLFLLFGSMNTNIQAPSDVVVTVGVEWGALIVLIAVVIVVVVAFIFFARRRRRQ